MTQNEKDLLLKDLCARLPYNVRIEYKGKTHSTIYDVLGVAHGRLAICLPFMSHTEQPLVEEVKPYLFPLSNMNEDQKYEFYLRFIVKDCNCVFDYFKFCLDNGKWHKLLTSLFAVEEIIDWFHKNHFDYRGLIPMGLAIDATGLNIY